MCILGRGEFRECQRHGVTLENPIYCVRMCCRRDSCCDSLVYALQDLVLCELWQPVEYTQKMLWL